MEFPEIFFDLKNASWLKQPGFDITIGNPPFEVLMSTESDQNYINHLNESFRCAEYRINLYGLFIERSIGRISKNTIGLIIPNTILANKYFEKLRRFILKTTHLQEIIFFEDMPFPDATVEPIIFITQKKYEFNSVKIKRSYNKNYSQLYTLKTNDFLQNERSEFRIFWKPKWLKLVKKLKSQSNYISNYFKLYNGIKTTDNSKFIKQNKINKNWKPVIRGSDISRYSLKSSSHFVLFDKKKLKSGFDESMHLTSPKILIRRADNRMIATIDNEKFYALDTLHIIKQISDIDTHELLPIINSKLSNWWLKLMQIESGKILPEVKIDFLNFFPIPNKLLQNEKLRKELNKYSETITNLYKKKQNLISAIEPFKFINKGVAFGTFQTVFTEGIKYGQLIGDGMDYGKVHHDIEGLKLEPVNNSDGSEIKSWLLSCYLKHRDPKTGWSQTAKDNNGNIIRSTPPVFQFEFTEAEGHYWQQAFEILDQFENSHTFPGGKARTTYEKLLASKVPVFDQKANIKPLIELREELAELEEKIEKTDWLIDQVVYRLYGLSDEEIKIVENS